MDPHRFDTLTRFLTDARSRRGALATLLGGTLGLGGLAETAAKQGKLGKNGNGGGKHTKDGNGKKHGKGHKKNGNGNDKRNGNDKKNGNGTGNDAGAGADPETGNDIPARCGEETCARTLPEDQFVACAEKCGQCRIREQFCVISPDAEHPGTHATCCFEHQQCCQDSLACCDKTATCCGDACCASDRHCCGGKSCCAANQSCCGENCGPPPNDPDLKCCNGSLWNTKIATDHCGVCGNACGAGEVCRAGSCVCEGPGCPQVCRDHDCPPGQLCYNGANQYCSGQTSIDCQCGCGGSNYCPHPVHGAVCQSNPC